MSPTPSSIADHGTVPAARTGTILPILLAAILGVLLLTGAGFVQIEAVHNLAHDVRHANGFPCH